MNRKKGEESFPPEEVRPQYPIESVDNALQLISLIAERGELRLTDASAYLGVANSTAHRLLAMLQYRGFIRRDPVSKLFMPGISLLALSSSAAGRLDLYSLCRPTMESLVERFNETVTIGTLQGTMLAFVAAIEGHQAIRVASRAGQSKAAHCTAMGKALLALLDPGEIVRRYPREKLVQETPYSLSRRSDLLGELERIRSEGYAVNRQESELRVSSVAVAILLPGPSPVPIGGINISAPDFRMEESRIVQLANALVDASKKIAAGLD